MLVTGATSGIGEVFARWYADSASELVLVGRNKSELDRVASAVRLDIAEGGFGIRLVVFNAAVVLLGGARGVGLSNSRITSVM